MKPHEEQFDIMLCNGTVIDGSGAPAYRADVAIVKDRVVQLGDLSGARAKRRIDVGTCVISPGFIDVHSHDDAALISTPEMLPKLTQGVTTVIGGNCGISAAPYLADGPPPNLLRLLFKSPSVMGATFDEYLDKVRTAQPAVNTAFLTGHTTLRMQVMGQDLDRCASAAEISTMRTLLTDCLRAGSFGLSTGLFYPPARAASTEEIVQIAEPLQEHDALYVTHMRDEADGVLQSLEETLQIGRTNRCPVIISHHKCMGRKNYGRSVQTLALLERARTQQRIALDVYPYTAGSSILNEQLVSVSSRTVLTWCDPYPEYRGRDLRDVANEWGCELAEAVPRLVPAGAVYFMMDEADVMRIMRYPDTMIGSDGLPQDDHPHPRLWGTFPRVLGQYVRERGVLPLEEAIHRMTGLPATRFGLHKRGHIREDYFADICVFDPDTVIDGATYEHPTRRAVGIHLVLVNGQLALDNGVPSPTRAGRILMRQEQYEDS